MNVSITILDANDIAPMFSQESYSKSVLENNTNPDGTVSPQYLLTVTADDGDQTEANSDVQYRISEGNTDNLFEINSMTVSIIIKTLKINSIDLVYFCLK